MTLEPMMIQFAGETFGAVLRTRRAGGFTLRESRYAAGPEPRRTAMPIPT